MVYANIRGGSHETDRTPIRGVVENDNAFRSLFLGKFHPSRPTFRIRSKKLSYCRETARQLCIIIIIIIIIR